MAEVANFQGNAGETDMEQAVTIYPIVDIRDFITDGELMTFNIGPDRCIYLVVILDPPSLTPEEPRWITISNAVIKHPYQHRVLALLNDRLVQDFIIEVENFDVHNVQPLGDEILLVNHRTHYEGPNDFVNNARFFTSEGKFVREIFLGDGIETVQTTSNRIIWTSYFDEGIFGADYRPPIGAPGLIAWDANGRKVYEFQRSTGLDWIMDCNALNVVSDDDTWCYYYFQYPLVHIHRNRIKSFWNMPIEGSTAFAVSGRHALFHGGYKDRDTCSLFSLEENEQARLLGKFRFRTEEGYDLAAERVVGRGDALYLLCDGLVYRIEIRSLIHCL